MVFFDYWMVTLELLSIGIPYDVINDLSPQDLTYVMAFHTARKEREQEMRAEQEAKTVSSY